ncbi:MAG TPA: ThiF family adenylyltransferase [Allosphingosinicella sp.]|jgi:hypothetical protein
MTVTLVLSDDLVAGLIEAVGLEVETGGVLLAKVAQAPNGDIRLLGRRMCWVPADAYLRRAADELLVPSLGYVPALGEAEAESCMALWVHTHPGENGVPLPSRHDRKVDKALADLFQLRSGSGYYGTLILSRRGAGLAFSGTLVEEGKGAMPINRLWQVGSGLRLTVAHDARAGKIAPLFDRNVRAFGPAIQGTLSRLVIAIVGAGGTGSAVAEQLVRLGVRSILLIDPDVMSASNTTRVYGSTLADVGRPKVDVLANHLCRIAPDVECRSIRSTVSMEAAARQLVACDLVFGCTDDNAGRLVLSRLSSFMLTPVIDVGVLLSSDGDGQLTGIDGRVTVLSPASACLVCRGRIDLGRAAAELRTPEERKKLEDEGYAPALGGVEPAVVAFTTSVAAAAVGELLERLIGYGPDPRPSEVLLRWHEREISTNIRLPNPGHYCDPKGSKLGAGIGVPFLEQTWPE